MKKKLTYRDKLLELAKIYNVKEIQEYIKRRKNLTAGQIELILRKNKIIIPKDFQLNFFKENFSKPIFKVSKQINSSIENLKSDISRSSNKFVRKIIYLKEESLISTISFSSNLWKSTGNAGLAFLNIFPKLGYTIYDFFGNLLTDLFNGIYNLGSNNGISKYKLILLFSKKLNIYQKKLLKSHSFYN